MQLWAWRSGEIKLQLVHRELDRDAWPTLQLSQEEGKAFHGVASAIACHNLDGPTDGMLCSPADGFTYPTRMHTRLHLRHGKEGCGC